VFRRSIVRATLTRSRWFDIPLTREESFQADKKLFITFGPSHDPEDVIMVDSIKMYIVLFLNKNCNFIKK
jgi:E3 ubiquitin-protein ligase UBR4